MISQKYQKPMFLNIKTHQHFAGFEQTIADVTGFAQTCQPLFSTERRRTTAWAHETIDYRDSDIYAVTEVYGSFLKWGIPTSPWVSLLNQSNDLDDLGYPPILGNIHIEQKEAMYIAYDKPILERHTLYRLKHATAARYANK